MAALVYQILSSSVLVSLGLYHMVASTRNHLKSPKSYVAKSYYPFPLSSSSSNLNHHPHHRLRYLQLYAIIACLLVAVVHQTLTLFDANPLFKGCTLIHQFMSLQSVALFFFFLVLTLALLLSECAPSVFLLPSNLVFGLIAAFFYLQSLVSWRRLRCRCWICKLTATWLPVGSRRWRQDWWDSHFSLLTSNWEPISCGL
ncbi:hypothetical protein ACFX15_031375 [Malus domestica]